ncbi:hypothetical protein RKD23_001283 [Streptomyces sp. SAI-170]
MTEQPMSDHTPSQAEGEPEDLRDMEDLPLPDTPTTSQAEGERDEEDDES